MKKNYLVLLLIICFGFFSFANFSASETDTTNEIYSTENSGNLPAIEEDLSVSSTSCGANNFIFSGPIDYKAIGNSMSYHEARDNCNKKSYSSSNLSIPNGATIRKVFLQWSGSGSIDNNVSLNGQSVWANKTFSNQVAGGYYFAAYADVTNLVSNGGTYTVSNLNWNNSNHYCQSNSAYGAWSMVVVYEKAGLVESNIHISHDTFRMTYGAGNYGSRISCVSANECTDNASLTIVSFEGDNYKGEYFSIDGQYKGNNLFRGQTAPNLDILTFNVSNYLRKGKTSLAYNIQSYQTNTVYGRATEGLFDFVKVLKYNTSSVTANAGNDVTITSGNSTTLRASGGSSYRWSTGATSQNITVNPSVTTTYTVTVTNGNCSDTDEVTVTVNEKPKASLGDWVFMDNDKDGVQDAGEPGVSGVEVKLYECNTNTSLKTTTTNASGYYKFDDLDPDMDYFVEFIAPYGLKFTLINMPSGGDEKDSDARGNTTGKTHCVNLEPGEFNSSLDAGLVIEYGYLGDTVFLDNDKDGVQDVDEPGVSGVEVKLYKCNTHTVIATTSTNSNGKYSFKLDPRINYTVKFILPDGYEFSPANQGDDTTDSDANTSNGRTACANVEPDGYNSTVDAGIYLPKASLGDTIFNDEDQDGVQDTDEDGVPGVTVSLFICNESTPIATTTTDANGNYNFGNLDPNVDYYVGVELPTGYVFSPQNQGGDTTDSDVNASGITACIELEPGENNSTVDAGIYLPKASLGDTIFNDEDQDGVQDTDEDGVPGVTVSLFICNESTPIATTTTDANGNYNFGNLDPNVDYYVGVELPTGYVFSPQNQGGDTTDSDVNASGITACIELEPGENNSTVDAGIYLPKASLGDTIFNDEDQDGVQDTDEDGVPGVTVSLFICNESTPIATTTTDANGNYNFGNLDPNVDYYVGVELPTGYVFSPQNQGGDTTDSDVNASGITACIELEPGENNSTVDAGIYLPKASLGDTIFNDEDQDGVQDTDEDGVPGVTVSLFICNESTPIATTTTDANGNYNFGNLDPNVDYYVGVELPTGYVFSPQNQGGDTTDSDVNASGITACIELEPGENNSTVDAGIYLPKASLGDTIFNDEDQDGVQDTDEDGVPGVTVSLFICNESTPIATTTTDANGNYNFGNLDPNVDYYVGVELPTGYVFSPQNQGGDTTDSDVNASGITACIELEPGENNSTVDAGIYLPKASLGDTIFNDEDQDGVQDTDEDGVPGVTVSLFICNESTPIATTTTDANGNYNFGNLDPNVDYYVGVELPTGYVFSPQNQGGDTTDSDVNASGITACIELEPGENNSTVDAGIYLPKASLGDTIFNDEDQDGVQDTDEDGVPGVTVSLFICNESTPIATTTTDANGNYNFGNLDPNVDYYVGVELPTGYVFSPQNQGGDTTDSDVNASGITACIELEPGENNSTVDAGIYLPKASLGDTIFNDEDQDGVQDTDEDGVPGVTVSLFICNESTPIATTTTDANGNYNFGNLDPNVDYYVGVELPTGYVFSPQNQGGDTTDSDVNASGITACIELEPGENNSTVDAGIYLPKASLGDTIFNDEDQDGVQDTDEDGVPGVTVSLFICNESTPIATTTTDANGNYNFGNLDPNVDYYVGVELPTGYVFSPQNQGGDTTDSDVNASGITACIELEPGENNSTVDAGIYLPKASLGDTIFNDEDQDGVQDTDEDGVPGVTVSLFICNESTPIATTTTDANGNYNFGNLDPNVDYYVGVELPTGYVFSPQNQGGDTTDSDVNASGITACIELEPGENDSTVDAGIYLPKASLGDTIFNDEDQDGVQDTDEDGVPGVTVSLFICNESTPIATTTTDANGNYNFGNLDPNVDYYVGVELPTGYVFSPQNQGGDTTDSDVNASGITACIELEPGENNSTVDAGIYIPCPADFANAGADQAICEGGQVTLTASGGGSYLWSNGATTAAITVSPDATTTYSVTVTSDAGCEDSDEVTVTVSDIANANAGADQAICEGGQVTLTASGGGSYLWSNGATTAAITVSPDATTTYSVTVTSDAGCEDSDEVTVTVSDIANANAGADQAICEGGQVTLTASGGGSYLWSNGATTAAITVSPDATTTYSVTVTSDAGCEDSDEVTVTVSDIANANAGADQAICEGGQVTLTASGGGSYLWSNGATTAAITVSPDATTTYSVTVTSDAGCEDSDEVTVTVSDIANANAGADQAICEGGQVTLTASGGGSYLWSNGATTAAITVSPDATTTYSVTVTSDAGCEDSDEVTVTVSDIANANAGADQAICEGGQVTLTASGGGSYLWSNGATTAAITVSPDATTTYSVTVTSDAGCEDSDEVTITVSDIANANAGADQAICEGGQVTLTASGGGSYLWSNGATTAAITVSPDATTTYSVTVTSDAGCEDSDEVTVTVSDIANANAGADQAICEGGQVTLTASGGGSYLWSNGATTAAITVSPDATTTYSVTVTSDAGCEDSDEVTVTVSDIANANAGADQAICEGGQVTLTASGGGSYLWSNGATTAAITVSPDATTTYSVTVTSDAGCEDSDEVTVTVSDIANANAGADQAICEGGQVTLTASGGGSYLWSNGATTAAITVSPDATTTYSVTVTSDAGCEDSDEVTVTVSDIANANAGADQAICEGGQVTLTASGGGSYLWSNGATTAAITVSPDATTTYSVTVTSDAGCEDSDEVTVTVSDIANANAGADQAICEGGQVTLTASGGGSYLWSNGATTAAITVSPDATTTYSVTVTSDAGCEDSDEVTVTVSDIANANAGADQAICEGGQVTLTASGGGSYLWSNGATTAAITVSPDATTTYSVTVTSDAGCEDSDEVTVTVNGMISIGNYVWSDTNQNGIQDEVNTGINGVDVMLYSCTGGDNSQGNLLLNTVTYDNPISGEPGYYNFEVCANSGDYYIVFGYIPGGHEFTSTDSTDDSKDSDADSNGVTDCFPVYNEDINTVDAGVRKPCGLSAGISCVEFICSGETATLTAFGGNTYLWSNGATTPSIDVSPSETSMYHVTVSDSSNPNCSEFVCVTLGVLSVNIEASEDVTIEQGESTKLTVYGLASEDQILWSTGEITKSINVSPDSTTEYSVTVISKDGCIGEDSVLVTVEGSNCPVMSLQYLIKPIDTEYQEGNETSGSVSDDFHLMVVDEYGNESYTDWEFEFELASGNIYKQNNNSFCIIGLSEADFGTYTISWKSPDGCEGTTTFELKENQEGSGDTNTQGLGIGSIYPVPATSNSFVSIVVNTEAGSIKEDTGYYPTALYEKTAKTETSNATATAKEEVWISLYDGVGKLMNSPRVYEINKGRDIIEYNLDYLPVGKYIVKLNGLNWSDSKNIIVK